MIAIGILLFVSMMLQLAGVCITLAIFGLLNEKKGNDCR